MADIEELKPVAWRVKDFADGWILFHDEAQARREAEGAGNLVEPLYPAKLLEENQRLVDELVGDLGWIAAFAATRAADDSKTFAKVSRAALRTIAARARSLLSEAKALTSSGGVSPSSPDGRSPHGS